MLVCFVVAKKARNEIQQRQSEPPAWSDDLGRLITGDESLHFEWLPRLQTTRRASRGPGVAWCALQQPCVDQQPPAPAAAAR